MITYLYFLFFPLLARCIISFRKRKTLKSFILGWVIGFFQDLAIASAFMGLSSLGVPIYLLAIGLIYPLFDALLLVACDFRMRFTFFRYLPEFKDFKSSAKEMGIIPYSFSLIALYVAYCFTFWALALHPQFSFWVFATATLLGLTGLYFKGRMYLYSNAYFQEIQDLILRVFKKESAETPLALLLPECEIARNLHPHYPLFKMTEGFYGEKQFHIDIKENEKPHVILIALESMGGKYIGCLNKTFQATPNLDQLANEGILFTHFHSAGIPTTRSLFATLFGLHPDLESPSMQERDPLFPLIGSQNLLNNAGYHSIYHKGGSLFFLNAIKYLKSHGFSELAGDEQVIYAMKEASRTSWGVHDVELFEYSANRLKQLDDEGKSVFMTLCTISNHHPWQVPKGFNAPTFPTDNPLLARYLQTVFYTDYAVGSFVKTLKRLDLSKKTILFITADNAQPMGEHENNYMPLKHVYEENHRIPLIIFADGRIEQPKRIDDVGSQVDLLPTMMDILSLKGANHSLGTSLQRKAKERRAFCVNTHILPYLSYNMGDYKYMLRMDTDEKKLFNLRDDPEERENLITSKRLLADKLHKQLINHFSSLQKLYKEKRITPVQERSLVCLGDPAVTDDTLLQEAKKKKSLHSILISDCDALTDHGLIHIFKKAKNLEFLYLNRLHLTDLSLKTLIGKTEHLKELTLSFMYGIPQETLIALIKNCPELEELTLSGNLQVHDDLIQTIVKFCQNLENLELAECLGLTSDGIAHLAKGCPKLNRLNLQGLTSMNDQTLKKLSKGHYDLHALHILHCPQITGNGLVHFCRKNRYLKRLSFSGDFVETDALIQISKNCQEMMKLIIHGCQKITEEGFTQIAENCQKLVILELADCPQLTDNFFQALADKPLDHLLIAGAPQITDQALKHIEKLHTLRALLFYHCPKITEEALIKTGEQMHKTGLLHEVTLNRRKKIFYKIY